MKRHIPNIITSGNLLCGAVAVILACSHMYAYAFLFICLGAFFDFFDGLSARALGVSSPLGVQLDSLADDITFGLAPATIVTCYLEPVIGYWAYGALLMAAFSALRLAKFNIDDRQHTSFIGLATPANAIFWGGICAMPFFPETQATGVVCYPEMAQGSGFMVHGSWVMGQGSWLPWVLLGLTLVSDYLLISEIPFFSLKFKSLKWADNSIRYIFLIGAAILLIFCTIEAVRYEMAAFGLFAGTAIIIWYVCINLVTNLLHRV